MIMGQASHAIKHAQNHLKNIEKILVWVNMANFGLRILGNILKYGSGLNVLRFHAFPEILKMLEIHVQIKDSVFNATAKLKCRKL